MREAFPPLRRGGQDDMGNIIQIARGSLLVMAAALGVLVGGGMLGYSVFTGPPARASLQKVEGTISEASRVTRTSRRTRTTSAYYELTLRPAAGTAELKLRIPNNEIAEADVRSLIGRFVQAELDSEQDVYVLRSGNRDFLTYAATVERRRLSFRQYYVDGIAILIGSGLVMVLGFVLGYRKLRRQGLLPARPPGA